MCSSVEMLLKASKPMTKLHNYHEHTTSRTPKIYRKSACAKNHSWKIISFKFYSLLYIYLNLIKIIDCRNLLCTPCDIKNEIGKNSGPAAKAAYEEYLFEHQVTKQEAIEALNLLNETFFNEPLSPGCKAIDCNSKVMKYCLGGQFLNDHCWCDQRHGKEGLPFIPHTCYVGDQDVGTSVGTCYFYAEVKECCCIRALARRWKSMSLAIKNFSSPKILLTMIILTIINLQIIF